jgi:hypothetical protein
MKKILTFVFVLGFVFYLNNVSTFAQSRGTGHGPDVTGGHAPDINHSTDHGKSGDHANTNHATNEAKGNTDFINRINANTKLRDRLTDLIPKDPATGQPIMTLADAAKGFKNQGQFIACMHVANNLHLSLADWNKLRGLMTGQPVVTTTGQSVGTATGQSVGTTTPLSLGKALHEVNPNLSQTEVSAQVEQAESQAKVDVKITTTKTTS